MKHDRDLIALASRELSVISAPYPFYARDPQWITVVEGMTIAEIAARLDLPPGFLDYGVAELIETTPRGDIRHAVPNDLWHRVTPRVSRGVPIKLLFRSPDLQSGGGGGGKKNPLALVATVAVIALSFAVSGGLFNTLVPTLAGNTTIFGASISTAKLAGAGIGLIGLGAIAALSKPPALPGLPAAAADLAEPNTAALQANTLAPNAPLPFVIGTKRIAPPALCEPLIEDIGDDQYAECVYALAGPHNIKRIMSDLTPVTEIPGVETTLRRAVHGEAMFRGFKDPHTDFKNSGRVLRYAHTETPGIQLSQHLTAGRVTHFGRHDLGGTYYRLQEGKPLDACPKWHAHTLRVACDETWITLTASAGWYPLQPSSLLVAVPFRIRLSKINDDGTVGKAINLPEIMFAFNQQRAFNATIKLFWRAPTRAEARRVRPPDRQDRGAIFVYGSVPGQPNATKDISRAGLNGWTAHRSFANGRINSGPLRLLSAQTLRTSRVKNVRAFKDRVEIFMLPGVAPRGVYKMEIVRGVEFSVPEFNPVKYRLHGLVNSLFGYQPRIRGFTSINGTSFPGSGGPFVVKTTNDGISMFSQTVVSRIASVVNKQPSPNPNVAVLGLRVKNKSLGTITARCAALVPDWNGAAWVGLKPSSNPATHARNILTHRLNLTPVGPGSINDTDFRNFRTRCISENYQCNGEITGLSVPDAFKMIVGPGFGFARNAETFGVGYERDTSAEGVVQTFTPFSSRQFRASKSFPALASGLRVIFGDVTNNDLDAVRYVYADSGVNPSDIEEVRYPTINSAALAIKRARFDLRFPRMRPTEYTLNVPAQFVYCRTGDLVGVQHDVLDNFAVFGRLLTKKINAGTGKIIKISVDNPFIDATAGPTGTDGVTGFPKSNFGVALEWRDGTVSTHECTVSEDGLLISFNAPFDDDIDVTEGIQVMGGAINRSFRRMMVSRITPKSDNTADLTLFAEANRLLV